MKLLVLLVILSNFLLGCSSSPTSDLKNNTDSHEVDSSTKVISKQDNESTIDSFDHNKHTHYFALIDSLKNIFITADSLNQWTVQGEIIDSVFEGEGSGWNYFISDSLALYVYGQYGCSRNFKEYLYAINDSLVLYRDVETVYNAPLGYDRDQALLEGDSTEYGEPEIFEVISVFRNNQIVYQFSGDCGAPNSPHYIKLEEGVALEMLEEVKGKIKRNR